MGELTLSEDQDAALQRVGDWYAGLPPAAIAEFCDDDGHAPYPHTHGHAQHHPVLAVGGLAGTGKTTIARLLSERLNARISFGTPTHKAAAVLRRKLDEADAGRVSTYHSLVYHPMVSYACGKSGLPVSSDPQHRCGEDDENGGCSCPGRFETCGGCLGGCRVVEKLSFERRAFLGGLRHLIVIDEASMLTEAQVEDVRSFGVPLLLIGDHGQLPPVKADMNPWIAAPDALLERNHRQGEGSGIIDVAHAVRGGWRPTVGRYGDGSTAVISRRESPQAVISMLQRFDAGPRRAVIVWRNRTRCELNGLLRGRTGDPTPGDRVVCLKGEAMRLMELDARGRPANLHGDTYVHNGELGTVLAALDVRENTITLVVKLDDPDPERGVTRPIVRTTAMRWQFGEPAALAFNDRRRPRGAHSWDWGYALTAHKAQGSEWDQVVVVDEGAMDYERWTYTAVTRAKEKLVVVKW